MVLRVFLANFPLNSNSVQIRANLYHSLQMRLPSQNIQQMLLEYDKKKYEMQCMYHMAVFYIFFKTQIK